MRSLTAADNTDAATGDYPYRKVRDTIGVTDGTKLWDRIFADLLHGLQKLIRLVGLAPNDLPDNETNGYQILDSLELLGQSRVFSAEWTDAGGGDKYILASGIPALIVGKIYRFISDKNLLPADDIYLKVGIVDYAINFQNCSFILSNQTFNVYVTDANNVTITTVGTLNEYLGSAINRFETFANLGALGGIFKYKGKYYVSILNDGQIKRYSNDGVFEQTLSPAEITFPGSITVVDDKIYVVDHDTGDIVALTLGGSFLFRFGSSQFSDPRIVRSSNEIGKTSKIYVVTNQSLNNAYAYNASDGLYSFTFSGANKFIDIVIHGLSAYLLSSPGDAIITTYDAENGALAAGGLNTFEAAKDITRFYGINDNYFILKSGDNAVLVDKNYQIDDVGDPYRDILKTVIYDYSFADGNVDGEEMYFIDNSADVDRFSINKFI